MAQTGADREHRLALRDERVGTQPRRQSLQLRLLPRRVQNDASTAGSFTNEGDDLFGKRVRHVDVEQHELGSEALRQLGKPLARRRTAQLESVTRQRALDELDLQRIII